MNPDLLSIFNQKPAALPIYQACEAKILTAFPDVRIKVSKTQISLYNKYLFAALWPPTRKIKNSPDVYLGLTFGLQYRLEHPRIAVSVQPYPNRWTHHVILADAAELDAQILAWLQEAYDFSLSK